MYSKSKRTKNRVNARWLPKSSSFPRVLLFFCFFLITVDLQAQNGEIDSLKTLLENHSANDTIRVTLLNKLAFEYFRQDEALTNSYLNRAENLSDSLNYIRGKATIMYIRGILENRRSDYRKSLNYFRKSLLYFKTINDKNGIAKIYTAFGITHYDRSQYGEALDAYNKALELYKKLENKREQATLLINMGNVYFEIGKYEDAITDYKEALVISEKINDQDGVSFVYSNLANVYKVKGNYPLSIDYHNKALDYNIKDKDTLGIAHRLNDLGEVYYTLKKADKAMAFHERSLSFALKMGNKRLVAENNSNIGNIYLNQKKYEKALYYYSNSLKASQEINDPKQMAISFNNLGRVYLLLKHPQKAYGNFVNAKEIAQKTGLRSILANSLLGIAETYLVENEYQKALTLANKGHKMAKELEILKTQKEALEILSKIYEAIGNYKKALESHQQYKILNDSLFNKENVEKIAQLEYEYKYKQALDSASIRELKLNKTVLTTSQDLAKTKQSYLWAVIGILATSILSGSFVFYQKYKTVKIKNQNIATEQKLLRSQMTPHFIFNSLSVLQGMILNKEEKKSVTYLSKFSKLLRIVLENSRDKIVPLIQELDAIDNYMILQNLDAHPPYDYSLVVDENIDINQFLIPPMLIQPFIENAIEHAFTADQEHREIAIHIRFEHKKLSCTITDNGVGINAINNKPNTKKKSLATTITGERLQLLAKDFHMPGDLKIEDRKKDKEQGTKVTLVIPYKLIQNS